jgi:hypothetical protein
MIIPGFLKTAFKNAFYVRSKRMRSYIENVVENVISNVVENVISNVVENVISNVVENVIENALKTVALLTPLKTVQFLFKLSMLTNFTVQTRENLKIDFKVSKLHLELQETRKNKFI